MSLDEFLAEQARLEAEMFDDDNPTLQTEPVGRRNVDRFNECMQVLYGYNPVTHYEAALDMRSKAQRCVDAIRNETPYPTEKQKAFYAQLQRQLDDLWKKKEAFIEQYGGDRKDSLTPFAVSKDRFMVLCEEVGRSTNEEALTASYGKAFSMLEKMSDMCEPDDAIAKTAPLLEHLNSRHDQADGLIKRLQKLAQATPKPYPDTEPLGTVISEPTVIEVERISRNGEPDTVTITTHY